MDSTELMKNPEVVQTTKAVDAIVTMASTYQVTTAQHYESAGNDLQRVKAAQKKLEELRTTITKPLNAALKAANDFFRAPADRLVAAERQIKGAMSVYSAEQERIRQEQQRKADEAARLERERVAAAARETQRLADEKAARERAEAERQRQAAAEAERLAREARERGDREAAAEAERQQAAANAAAARSDRAATKTESKAEEKVAALNEQAATTVAPIIQREATKVAGIATRKVPKFEVVNAKLVPDQYKIVDEKKIRGVVNSLRLDANIPGVRVWLEDQIAAGSAA